MQLMFELPEAANSDRDLKQQELSGEYFTKALVCSLFLIYHDSFCIWPSYVEDFVAVCFCQLHHVGEAPYKLIAPIILLWKPVLPVTGDIQMDQSERDLWIWVHAAAFEEALQALQLTCRKVVMMGI